jgi:tight adherence protein C
MEYLLYFLKGLTDNPELLRLAFILLAAAGVFIFGMGTMFLVTGMTDPLRRRMRQVAGVKKEKAASAEQVTKVVKQLSPYILPQKGWERTKISTLLVQAGNRSANALSTFYALKTILGVILPLVVLATATLYPHFSASRVIFAALLAGMIGFRVPNLVLNHLCKKRRQQLRNGLPDALDLLVVCVEAGLGLNAAIERVSRELGGSHPAIADELGLVNAEIRAGAERIGALKGLADRTGLEDIRGLVSLLAQSLRFGTSVADTLRIYSEEFRDKRMQLAEEKAAKIGTKMIFPMVVCLFPSFFLVAIGPAVLRIIAAFANLNQ